MSDNGEREGCSLFDFEQGFSEALFRSGIVVVCGYRVELDRAMLPRMLITSSLQS